MKVYSFSIGERFAFLVSKILREYARTQDTQLKTRTCTPTTHASILTSVVAAIEIVPIVIVVVAIVVVGITSSIISSSSSGNNSARSLMVDYHLSHRSILSKSPVLETRALFRACYDRLLLDSFTTRRLLYTLVLSCIVVFCFTYYATASLFHICMYVCVYV